MSSSTKKKHDSKTSIETEVLRKLEQYGESLLDNEDYLKRKKKAKKRKKLNSGQTTTSSPEPSTESVAQASQSQINSVHRKKKRRRKKGASESGPGCVPAEYEHQPSDPVESECPRSELKGEQRQLWRMKEELGLIGIRAKDLNREENTQSGNRGKQQTEIVVFSDRRKQKHKSAGAPVPDQSGEPGDVTSDNPEFDMKQARFDVRKFGIQGFQGGQKEEAMTALLIKLGAKPPKRKFYNYKEFQEMRKKEIEDEKQKREVQRSLGYKVVNPNKRRKQPRGREGVVDGQVGKFKDGVQFVKTDDLKGFKRKRLK